jgi:hypothetical protein
VFTPYQAHGFFNSTTNELCVTAQLRFDCPVAPATGLGAAAYRGSTVGNDVCGTYLGDSGADGTQPFSFRVPPLTNFVILVSARAANVICSRYTLELFGLPCPPPTLRIAKDNSPGKVQLQWSTAYPDHRLQTINALRTSGPNAFTNVTTTSVITGGKYTVTNSATQPRQFFRLAR